MEGFFFFGGGVLSPSNSLLDWIVVRDAWILKWRRGRSGIEEAEPEGRVLANPRQGRRNFTRREAAP